MKKTRAFSTIGILTNTLLLVIIAGFSHFAYELSGNNIIVGLFNPVNESVWEHLKFMFFPFLLWWLVIYKIKSKRCIASTNTWIVSAAVSLVVAPLLVVLFYYGYTSAFGIKSFLIDILISGVSFAIALSIASHFLEYSSPNTLTTLISVIVIVIIFSMFIVFTIFPPNLPLFISAT